MTSVTDKVLIDVVRKYPCLYDSKLAKYKNISMKRIVWEKIGKELQTPDIECKNKWNLLRNAYVHALIRRNEAGDKVFPKWKLEDEMSFLKPFVECRKMKDNFRKHKMAGRRLDDDFESDEEQDQFVMEERKTEYGNETPKPWQTYYQTEYDPPEEKNIEIVEHDVEQEYEKEEQKKAKKRRASDEEDELDLFFQYLRRTIKKLPKIEQIQLKTDMISLVSQAEMRSLQPQSSGSKNSGTTKTETLSSTRHQIKKEPGTGGDSSDFDDPIN